MDVIARNARQNSKPAPTLPIDFLEALQRMVRQGHLPSSLLAVRLTDGRIRLNALVRNPREARDALTTLCNEHGPAEIALWISAVREGAAVRLAVESLAGAAHTAGSTVCRLEMPLAAAGHTFAGEGSGRSAGFSASSRKRAMREASLGITTGWLPNVELSLLPSGARSWSV